MSTSMANYHRCAGAEAQILNLIAKLEKDTQDEARATAPALPPARRLRRKRNHADTPANGHSEPVSAPERGSGTIT